MIAMGVLLPLVGGVLNASWCVPARPDAPKWMRIEGWEWEHTTFVQSILTVILNAVYICAVLGEDMQKILDTSDSKDLAVVCILSVTWSVGILCYGIGQKMAGVAVGVSLSMSLLVVIGTLIPLLVDNRDSIGNAESVTTFVGVFFAILGFLACAKASLMKDAAKAGLPALKKSPAPPPGNVLVPSDLEADGLPAPLSGASLEETKEEQMESQEIGAQKSAAKKRFLLGVAICALCAVMSSSVQAAFILGKGVVAAAAARGLPPAQQPLIVWFFAFTLGSGVCALAALALLVRHRSWGRLLSPAGAGGGGSGGRGRCLRNCRGALVMAVCFVAHIHLYGAGQAFLGDLGPAIAWPLIMSSSVLFAQGWGFFLGEWQGAPKTAMTVNRISALLLVVAVSIIGAASFV